MEDEKKMAYLKGHKEGFESALKMAWQYIIEAKAELYSDNSNSTDVLDKLEEKMKS